MKRQIFVHTTQPQNFNATVEAAAVYLLVNNKILFLKLSPHKKEAGRWGVPAGKKEKDETIESCVQREVFEETGLVLEPTKVGVLYISKPEINYSYHLFTSQLAEYPEITLSEEHVDYKWATLQEAEQLPLMEGALEALKFFFSK